MSLCRLVAERSKEEGWHEPDESRGSCPDLWGTGGEIPPVYPAGDEGRPLGAGLQEQASNHLKLLCLHSSPLCRGGPCLPMKLGLARQSRQGLSFPKNGRNESARS